MDNVSCALSNEGKLTLLPGCPRFGDSVEGRQQGFVVSPQLKLAALQGIPEVADGSEGGQQLPVKRRILTLRGGQLLGEETQRTPTFYLSLLQDTPDVGVSSVSG